MAKKKTPDISKTCYIVEDCHVMNDARHYTVHRAYAVSKSKAVNGDVYRDKNKAQRVCDEKNLPVYETELEHHRHECKYYEARIKEIKRRKGENI